MRGQHAFSPEHLRSELAPLDQNVTPTSIEPPEFSNYQHYYDLDLAREYPGLTHRVGYLSSRAYRIAVQIFEPPEARGTAIVCHGYYDHVGLYGHLIRYLISRKLSVVAFDQPGHGLSSGQPATIEDFEAYVEALVCCLDAVAGITPEPWHILGQSMGGSVVLEYLRQSAGVREPTCREFKEVVLFAPLVRPALWPMNRIFFEVVRRMVSERPRTFTDNAQNPEFLSFIRKDPMQAKVLPVQWVVAMTAWMKRFENNAKLPDNLKIIQGHMDRTVGWRYNLKVLDRMCDSLVLHLPEGRHHLVNESELLREQMWRWLDDVCQWN